MQVNSRFLEMNESSMSLKNIQNVTAGGMSLQANGGMMKTTDC